MANAITMTDKGLNVPDHPIIPFIEGDGIGPDIWKASVMVFDAAVEKAYGGQRKVQWKEVLAGEKAHNETGCWLPDDTLALARAAVQPGPATSWSFPVVIQRVNPPNVERELFPDSYQQNVPGYTVMFMFFIVTVIAASVFKERSSGALRRVRATPVSRIAIVIGKTLPFFAINFLQAVIMFTVARLGFSMDLVNIPALLVVTAGLSLAATGMGSMITNLVRTEAQAGSIGVLLILILAMLGGSMIPRSIMPEAMQPIGLIAPQSWALTAYQDVLVRGFGIAGILQETLILIAYGAIFLAVSIFRFRYE